MAKKSLWVGFVLQVIDGQLFQYHIDQLSTGQLSEVSGPNDLSEIVGLNMTVTPKGRIKDIAA